MLSPNQPLSCRGRLARRWTPVRTLVIALMLSAVPALAQAKCIIPVVNVSGKVMDPLGNGVSGASVGVSWVRAGLPQGPALGTTDAEGAFQVQFHFNTFTKNSVFRGDVCKEELKFVSVSANASGLRSAHRLVRVQDWSAIVSLKAVPLSE